jgi:uncharacterized protein YqgC (DUF456 family)
MTLTVALDLLAGLLVLIGLAGTVLPVLPGAPLIFAGLVLAAWADGFTHVGLWPLVILGLLTLLSLAVDLWASAHGARRVGASRWAILGAVLGTIVGLAFGVPGLLLGPFVGALAGELLHRRSLHPQALAAAGRVGAGTWLGLALGAAFKLALALAMLGVFALAWWL